MSPAEQRKRWLILHPSKRRVTDALVRLGLTAGWTTSPMGQPEGRLVGRAVTVKYAPARHRRLQGELYSIIRRCQPGMSSSLML